MRYQLTLAYALGALIAMPVEANSEALKNPLTDSATWQDMRFDIVGDASIADGGALFNVDAPYRAHDAATVPVVIKQVDATRPITAATVIVDENPAPVAAEIDFGESMWPVEFELRVRVDQYSNVRVIAESDKGLFMDGRYVKASGGCSAPASRDPEVALAGMGQMKLRLFGLQPDMSVPRREAQIMIRHPNYSGLQRDQITQLFIPAHFINHIEVWQGDEMMFTLDGGISVSENPVFRFSYNENGAPALTVKATDTDGNIFQQELPKTAEG